MGMFSNAPLPLVPVKKKEVVGFHVNVPTSTVPDVTLPKEARAPDLTDDLVKQAGAAERRRAAGRRGRRAQFLTGPGGLLEEPATAKSYLGG